ncbi:S-layer homology domain-containing protein [Alteribacillus iranensis]|uniref:S-layer homology domain-containing protein n=1 Tax=Alteribacillus iranensis TaxID=930128 RepID=A0A1I2B063_9BACI|nr:S-layer homology domain-containing protein [Alteribacillus iranensis]SFE49397.1 S-layer homology domain-containing protein [Alteribacillus iranensis]
MSIKTKLHRGAVSVLSLGFLFTATQADASSFEVSPGVTYEKDAGTGANILKVDLTNDYSQLDVGVPTPLNHLETTSQQARKATSEGHHAVGAINATFFDMGAGNSKLPFSIITVDNEIISFGRISKGREHYRSKPIVFGERSNGKASIGDYQANVSAQVNGKSIKIDTINSDRRSDEAVLFTPSYISNRTETNEYGMEIIVERASGNPGSFSFGDELTGTVTAVRGYKEAGNSRIPENGFVISAVGDKLHSLDSVKEGDTITVNASINDRWKDASFILGSGPQLVKNGEVNITMDPNSWRYTSQTARTAVGVDASGDNVYMVTMDKANIRQLAEYMKKIGSDRALNFDGGGSTTLVARKHGDKYASVMNNLSAGSERSVSATLQAISTAPTSDLSRLILSREGNGTVEIGDQIKVSYLYGTDQYYNPVDINENDVTWTVTNDVGRMKGSTFIAEKAGEGRIRAHYNGEQVGSVSVKVVKPALFKDVSADYWAASEIEYLYEREIIGGYGDGTYRPGMGLKRSQAASMMARAFDLNTANRSNPGFTDVDTDFHAFEDIATVADEGLMRGSGNEFRPNGELTRAQMAVILTRAFNLTSDSTSSFRDVDSDFWAYEEIEALAAHGIAKGSNGKFRPGETVSRAQFAVFMKRALEKFN